MKFKDILSKAKGYVFNSEDGRGDKYALYRSMGRANFGDGKNQTKLLSYNDISLYVNRAVDKRAEKVSEVEFVLKDSKGKVVERNWVIDLLNKPNDMHTGKQFWKLFQKHYDITGNAFIHLERDGELFSKNPVKSMHLLTPNLVTVKFNPEGTEITGYDYASPTGIISYTTDEVIYAFNPDPSCPLRGESLLRSGVRAIETEITLAEYHARVLQNGGKVDGVFKFKTPLNKQQIKEMKEAYIEERAGAAKADIPLFLGGEADYIRLGLNPEELSYLESKVSTIKDITALTGVPLALLGVTQQETFANADAAIGVFLRETIKPLIINLVSLLDWRLVPEEFELDYVDPTPEDVDRKIKLATAAYGTDSSTINERRSMLGLEPSTEKEADMLFVSFTKTPIGSEPAAPAEKSIMTKAGKAMKHPLQDPEFRKMYGDVQLKRFDSRQSRMLKDVQAYFKSQKLRIIDSLGGLKQFKKKGLLDEIFDTSLEVKIARDSVLPLLRQFLAEAGKDATEMLDYDFDFTVTSSIERWIDDRVNVFAHEINKTTFGKLQDQFSESFEAGETRQQLISRIEGVYDGFNDVRARTIARTEVHGAMQKGTVEGYRQAGSPIKIWVWASGVKGGVREEHAAMDGQERPIDMPFSNGLMWPGDPSGDPGETVNCECTI
ncbi:MAG: phage portal protein [Candidatus Paceibacterota bacterium]|jgi:HK97 family phage portal protein